MPRVKKTADTSVGPVLRVGDLTAGVNLRPSATTIKPNEARRLMGASISNPGELGVYPGFLSFSTSSLGSRRAQGGKRIYLAASTFTLAADNGNAYKPTDAGVWGSAVLTGLNTSNVIDFVYDRDIVAALDGANIPKKSTDGSTWSQLGIDPPVAAPGLAAVAGGSLVIGDTYSVSYAYFDENLNHVGNASASATQLIGANQTIRVSVTASTNPTVTKIKIYAKDDTAGESVRRLTATIANVTTTHDITANNWDGQEEEPTDHDVAVPVSFGVVWKNRWWLRDAVVKNRLRFSQIFQNQSYPDTFYVDIPFERGEDITGFVPFGDILVVFGFTKFYLIIGQTSLDFEVRPSLGGQTGAFGYRAIDVLENGIVHAGAPGVYLFNGASDELLTYPIDPAWQAMIDASTSTELALLPVVYHKLTKELRIGVPLLYPTGDRGEWLLDLNRTASGGENTPAWFATNRAIGGYISWDGNEAVAGNQGRLFSWSPTLVKLYEERTGTSWDGSDLLMEYDGFALPFGFQVARVIETYMEIQPASGMLTVDLRIDGILMGTQSFSIGSALPRYGSAIYGVSTYGGAARSLLPVIWPLEAEGRTAQLLVKYTGQGDFKLYSYGHSTFVEDLPRGL